MQEIRERGTGGYRWGENSHAKHIVQPLTCLSTSESIGIGLFKRPPEQQLTQLTQPEVIKSLGGPQKRVKISIYPTLRYPSCLIPLRMAPLPSILTTTANVPAASSATLEGVWNLAFVATPLVDPTDNA